MQHNPWPNYRYYSQLPQQPFQNTTIDLPIAIPESIISLPVSIMSTTSLKNMILLI
jgi:hypothetical protein